MIKSFTEKELEYIKINVDLKNGKSFLGKDVPDKPFGINGIVSFWDGDALITIPFDEIKQIALYSEKD